MSLTEGELSHGFKVPYRPTVLNGQLKTKVDFLGSCTFSFLKLQKQLTKLNWKVSQTKFQLEINFENWALLTAWALHSLPESGW